MTSLMWLGSKLGCGFGDLCAGDGSCAIRLRAGSSTSITAYERTKLVPPG
jgi:hypothetical protein